MLAAGHFAADSDTQAGKASAEQLFRTWYWSLSSTKDYAEDASGHTAGRLSLARCIGAVRLATPSRLQ